MPYSPHNYTPIATILSLSSLAEHQRTTTIINWIIKA